MDSSNLTNIISQVGYNPYTDSNNLPNVSDNTKTIEATLTSSINSDAVEINLEPYYKSLTITAQKIIAKLNSMLPTKLTEETKVEDHTPEKTAESIVNGISLLFDGFKKANPKLEGEELVSEFMKLARKGVESGYSDAYETLKAIGAFDVNNVEDGVKQTKSFIDQKLANLESKLKESFAPKQPVDVEKESAKTTKVEIERSVSFDVTA